jgi:small-conductance mechanosensitive channel/CRP-like cAMP-binding protein
VELVRGGSLLLDRTADVVGVVVAIVLLALARWLLAKDDKRRVGMPVVYLVLAMAIGIVALFVDEKQDVGRVLRFGGTFFLLASIGRSLVLLGVDVVFGRRTHRAPPRIFRDVTQAIVYVVVILMTLHAVGVEPGSILTTSALLTAVVGLALQDTLGNMVSGLALQMQRPFEVGDWIQFDPEQRNLGKVTEVNWRATTVMTNDLVEVILPNALLAKAPIRNFSRPSPVSRRLVTVQGEYGVAPRRVQEAILASLVGAPGVLEDPAPLVQTRSFADSGIEYAVYFFTSDFQAREKTDAGVRDRVWYAMQRAGVGIPFPTRTLHMHHVSEETERRAHDRELERRDQVLRCVDFLDVLPPDAHRALAAAAAVRLYAPGETVVRQGDASNELFIIDRGEVAIELGREGGAPIQVARLAARKFFGEMGLLTGEARTATVRAASECELLVLDHAAFHDTLATHGGVVEKLGDLLAQRQAELEAAASSRRPEAVPIQERSKRLISQIKDWFKL